MAILAVTAAAGLALAACGGGNISSSGSSSGGSAAAAKCGNFNIAVNPWVGYEADAYVVGYVAKTKLGCNVKYVNVKEEVAWQGMNAGTVDTVLENWGHPDLTKKYVTDAKTVLDAGQTGNIGNGQAMFQANIADGIAQIVLQAVVSIVLIHGKPRGHARHRAGRQARASAIGTCIIAQAEFLKEKLS